MKIIILEDNFEFKQKAILGVVASFALLFLLSFALNFNNIINSQNFIISVIILIVSIIFFCVLVPLIFSRKGIKTENNKLFLTHSFLGKLLYFKEVETKNRKVFTILKNNVLQKNSFLSAGGADLSYKYFKFHFVIIDDRHFNKTTLLTLSSIQNAHKLKLFLERNSGLKYEGYSPQKSKSLLSASTIITISDNLE